MHWHLAIAALTLAAPLLGHAQDWVLYATSDDGEQAFLDRDSLKVAGELRTVWMRVETARGPLSYQGTPVKTWFGLEQVMCRYRVQRTLRESGYRQDGTLFADTIDGAAEFTPVRPDSVGEMRLNAICALAPPEAAPAGPGG